MVSLENVAVTFSGTDLFSEVSFLIGDRDRIGLVGRNGSGKSTLFRVLTGMQEPSQGIVSMPKDTRVGLLAQHFTGRSSGRTVLEETLTAFAELQRLEGEIASLTNRLADHAALSPSQVEKLSRQLADSSDRYHMLGGGTQEALAERTLLGLGFLRDELQGSVDNLSGGWRMRVELAKILLQKPDLLLLDEPTNHLDIESIGWLEEYLQRYTGAVVLVSHDRRFLDTVTQRTVELTLGHAVVFNMPYTKYLEQRAQQRELQLAAWRNQQQKIKETQEFIDRFRYQATKSNQVQSRIKQLARMELIEVEEEDRSTLRIRFAPAARAGDTVLKAREVSKSFGDKQIFSGATFDIQRGEKVAFVGRNGEGKSTFVKMIVGLLEKSSGEITLGHNVHVGYFAQDQSKCLNGNLTVFDTIDREATGELRTKVRDMLAAFLFRDDDIEKRVSVLSGGERNRLALLRLMLKPCNFLVLDEPTNHLDIAAKNVLKEALQRFDGTLLLVSHDRDFLSGLVGKVYEFTRHRVREHLGGIEAFLQTRRAESLNEFNSRAPLEAPDEAQGKPEGEPVPGKGSREEWKRRKQRDNELERRRRELSNLEQKIAELEQKLKELTVKLSAGGGETQSLLGEYDTLKRTLDQTMKRWEEKYYELDILENELE